MPGIRCRQYKANSKKKTYLHMPVPHEDSSYKGGHMTQRLKVPRLIHIRTALHMNGHRLRYTRLFMMAISCTIQ